MQTKDNYQPVAFNPKAYAEKERKLNPDFANAYDALDDEFSALQVLLQARKEAGLTQADIAQRMGVSQPVLARIESSLGSRKHSPSLATLRNYAKACGKKLTIQFDDAPLTQADIDSGKLKLVQRDTTGAVCKQHA
jgi:DNA-binding XRE family transcriptional regulator